MASEYYLKRDGLEAGPFGFRDLVAFAREGTLAHSDLVRFAWTNEWNRADSLVGLFHMAQRTPEIPAQAAPAPVPPPLDELEIQCEPEFEVPARVADDRPGWMTRLLFIGGRKKKAVVEPLPGRCSVEVPLAPVVGTPTSDVRPTLQSAHVESTARLARPGPASTPAPEEAGPAQPDKEVFQADWSRTVDEALAKVTARQSGQHPDSRPGRWRKVLRRLSNAVPASLRGDWSLHMAYRLASTIVFTVIVALSVEHWSQEEGGKLLRGASQKASLRLFPVVGKCSNGKYAFLMADLVLATGIVTWFAAGWLESHAE